MSYCEEFDSLIERLSPRLGYFSAHVQKRSTASGFHGGEFNCIVCVLVYVRRTEDHHRAERGIQIDPCRTEKPVSYEVNPVESGLSPLVPRVLEQRSNYATVSNDIRLVAVTCSMKPDTTT